MIAAAHIADHGVPVDMAYMNHARLSPCPRMVLAAMQARLEREYRSGWIEDDATTLATTQASIARLIGASADEIALTQGATHAFNTIASGLEWQSGDNVVVTDLVYRSMMMTLLRICERHAVDLRVVGSHSLLLAPEDFRVAVDRRTRLVLVPLIPTFCGVLQPVADIGDVVAAASDAHYVVNATQAVGQVDVNVQRLRCDFLFSTSRKWLRGPRGVGFFFARRDLISRLENAPLGYRAATWSATREYSVNPSVARFHAGDYSPALYAGLRAAADHAAAVGGLEIQERNAALARYARERVSAVPGVTILDRVHGTTGTLAIAIAEQDPDESVERLRLDGIEVCTIDEENNRLGLNQIGVRKLVRVSLHYTNTFEDIDRLAAALTTVVARASSLPARS